LILACALGLFCLGLVATRSSQAEPAPAKAQAISRPAPARVRKPGIWQPPAGLTQIAIWPHGAPNMTGIAQPPESVLTAQTPEAIAGPTSQAVFDVSAPTMTVFPPKGRNSGGAIVVFPGGGFQALAITIEGTEICDWLTARGITCVLSKYRVRGAITIGTTPVAATSRPGCRARCRMRSGRSAWCARVPRHYTSTPTRSA
jgi:acetyl esterase/lipase